MKICFIGKYPPIQGGVSRLNFWSSYALAREGCDVHVVTNASEVEQPFRHLEDAWFSHPLHTPGLPLKGQLTVHSSTSLQKQSYIPWANPFVSKLAAIATDVIEIYGCDLIYSSYLEPYAMAASLVSQWTNIPYGVRNAGSDIGRLFQYQHLQTSYAHVLQSADYLFATQGLFRRFLSLGIDFEKLYYPIPESLPTEYFHPEASPLDVNQFIEVLRALLPKDSSQGRPYVLCNKVFDPSLPTIGIYGKVGQTKGSFDLLRALGTLRAKGVSFNFLAVTQGQDDVVQEFVRLLKAYALEDVTWIFPFIPHWCIPNFLRACTAVCFLERGFSIKAHAPGIPREVFACGTCLVLSHEIARKLPYQDQLRQGSNVFLVDPLNTDELAATLKMVMENPVGSREVGMNGYRDFSANREDFPSYARNLAELFTTIRQDVEFRRKSMSVAEMQACLARLYVDDAYRQLFDLAPETSRQDYQLTEDEFKTLESLDKKMLDLFADMLKKKRKSKFQAAYPLLFQLLRTKIDRYYNRFYHLYPAKPHELFLPQALAFGEFMEECLATDTESPSYASDLARYERYYFSAMYMPSSRDSLSTFNEPEQQQPGALSRDAYPVLQPGVQYTTFAYDVVSIATALQEHQEVIAQKGTYSFIFQQRTRTSDPAVFAISGATNSLLALCDGSRTVSEIIGELEQRFGKDALTARVLQALHHLLSIGVLEV